jgi:hypothetical protein
MMAATRRTNKALVAAWSALMTIVAAAIEQFGSSMPAWPRMNRRASYPAPRARSVLDGNQGHECARSAPNNDRTARRSRPNEDLSSGSQRLLALAGSFGSRVHRTRPPFVSAGLGLASAGRHHGQMRRVGVVTAVMEPLAHIGSHALADETVLAELS